MTYNELQNLCEKRKMQIKEVTDALGMTYTGLRDALNRDTLSIKKLVPLCQLLGISPNDFFKWGSERESIYNTTQVGMLNNQNVGIMGIDILKEQLSQKDAYIKDLLEIIKSK